MADSNIPTHCVAFKTPHQQTCEHLAEMLGRHSGLTLSEVRAYDRRAPVVRARDEAMAYLRDKGWTYPQIGRFFDRDHSTCVVAVQRFNAR